MAALHLQVAALALFMVTSASAAAQVYKCTDASGSISYGEAACPTSAKKSVELKSKPPGAMTGRDDGRSPSEGAGPDEVSKSPTPPGPDELSAESAGRTLQRAQLQAEAARQRLADERSPGQLIRCDEVGCWGAKNGVRYLFAQDGKLIGANGSTCVRVAQGQFSCN